MQIMPLMAAFTATRLGLSWEKTNKTAMMKDAAGKTLPQREVAQIVYKFDRFDA